MNTHPSFSATTLLALLGVCLAQPGFVRADVDNFDSYTTVASFTAAGWEPSELEAGLVTTTFPAVGTGKGVRIQANSIPGVIPAVALWYRTSELTNFYLAVDVVAWADTNQAFALLARGSIVDDPSTASGYLVNYNVTQWGDAPSSPRQGELQLSVLSAPFSTEQLAIGELTLEPGRPYRFVFTGVGFHLKVQVYDLWDLTRPLLQMEADDPGATFASGVCGLMAYSRDDEAGVTDVTLDNYEVDSSDPNPATPPALIHPVPGTPTIESRIPVERFTTRHNPDDGLSFIASTYTTDVIDASATRLFLNDVDVSSQLVLSTDGPNLGAELPTGVLESYTVYSARIEVQDVTGTKRSTNTFWFDTFSEDYLTSPEVKIIEAEHYNYSNGVYQLDPIELSGYDVFGDQVAPDGIGYFKKAGVEGVDFHDARSTPEPLWAPEFRPANPVGLSQGMFPEIYDPQSGDELPRYSDSVRSEYAANNMLEYVVHRTQPGEWLNYTRDFAAGNYHVYLRVASLGASEVRLDRVTSNPAVGGQSTVNLGRFAIPNQFTRYHYRYLPLVDGGGAPVVLSLSDLTTLRLTMAGTANQDNHKLAINYLLFCPVPSSAAVTGRHVFYNRSTWDGNNVAADASDDAAIATNKTALLPGGIATFTNYTSYSRGLNGIMVDITNLPGTPTASDFTFKVGNSNNLAGWTAAPAPVSVTPRDLGGGVTRLTLIWNDNAIQNQWLQVTVKANATTGLAADDVFYFGNAIAETGDSASNANVLVNDALQILNHLVVGVALDSRFDMDRNRNVLVNDALICLNHLVAGTAALQLINLSGIGGSSLVDTEELIYANRAALMAAFQTTERFPSNLQSTLLAMERLSGGTMRFVFQCPGSVPVRVWQTADLNKPLWDLVPESWIQVPRVGLIVVELPAELLSTSGFFWFEVIEP